MGIADRDTLGSHFIITLKADHHLDRFVNMVSYCFFYFSLLSCLVYKLFYFPGLACNLPSLLT